MKKPIQNEFNSFIKTHFEGIPLKSPLFYNWDLALRFDLQPDSENPVSPSMDYYFDLSENRAVEIFETAFNENDEIYVLQYAYKWKRRKIRKGNFAFKSIQDFSLSQVDFSVKRSLYEINDSDDVWNQALIKTTTQKLNYKDLIKAIVNTDFPARKPHISTQVYFVNLSQKMIYHLYDDRGLDVLTSNTSDLLNIYRKHKEWLLKFDLQLMEERIKKHTTTPNKTH